MIPLDGFLTILAIDDIITEHNNFKSGKNTVSMNFIHSIQSMYGTLLTACSLQDGEDR